MDSNWYQSKLPYQTDENNLHLENVLMESQVDFPSQDALPLIGEHGEFLCDEHMSRKSQKEKATKWCLKCGIQACLECAFEFHTYNSHEKKDIINLEEFISNGMTQLKKIDDAFTTKENETCLFKRALEDVNEVEKKFFELEDRNIRQLESLKGKLDAIEDEIRNTFKNVRKSIQEEFSQFNKNEALKNYRNARMKLSEAQTNFSESLFKSEKLKILKSLPRIEDNLNKMLSVAESEIQLMKKCKSLTNDANILVEKTLNSALVQLNFDSYMIDIEKILSSISSKLKKNYISSNKDIDENLKSFISKVKDVTNTPSSKEFNQPPDALLTDASKVIATPTLNSTNFQKNNSDYHFLISPEDFILANPKEYDYLIALKDRDDHNEKSKGNAFLGELNLISRFSPENVIALKIEESFFTEKRKIGFPPEYCRYVNIGSAILITGGIDKTKNVSLDLCWLIAVNYIDKKYIVSISSYTPMKVKRERHNIVYLDNLESVIVCSGFYLKTSEILDMKTGQWKMLPDMAHARANATMCYINQSMVYCLGGFEVVGKDLGKYHGDLERLDIFDSDKGWTIINMEYLSPKVDLKLCAMGVIPVTINKIILVGGYNGKNYLMDASLIEFEENSQEIKEITHLGKKLNKGVIFSSSSQFIRFKNRGYNFDFVSKLIKYDIETNEFLQ